MGDKAAVTVSRRGSAWSNRGLVIRSILSRQIAQVPAIQAGGIRLLSRWTGGPRMEEGGV